MKITILALFIIILMSGCNEVNGLKTKSIPEQRISDSNKIVTQNQTSVKATQVRFSDVESGQWYSDDIQWASNLGLIDGYPDGSFQPNKTLTRAEVVKIIKSLADKGYITVPSVPPVQDEFKVTDPNDNRIVGKINTQWDGIRRTAIFGQIKLIQAPYNKNNITFDVLFYNDKGEFSDALRNMSLTNMKVGDIQSFDISLSGYVTDKNKMELTLKNITNAEDQP